MISGNSFEIKKYDFNPTITNEISDLNFAIDLWPVVYILSHGLERVAYIGETTDTVARLGAHLKNNRKSKLREAHIIESELFNKSATLDIESNLIKYISGDGQFELLNGNIGLANHNYYQKDNVYWGMFTSIWDQLRSLGVSVHSIEHINNSDLFKYSPYKSLSSEQKKGLLLIIDNMLTGEHKSIIMKGGAGTGKTVLAVFLFKLLVTDLSDFNFRELENDSNDDLRVKVDKLKQKFPDPNMALVVPMSSFRNTLKKVFSKVKGLKASMVVGPGEITKRKYDIVVVDEAHRLRRRKNLTNYQSFDAGNKRLGLEKDEGNELDWIRIQSKVAIYFYDPAQSIKPTDVLPESFTKMIREEKSKIENLTSQFRVNGGNGYVRFISLLLEVDETKLAPYSSNKYEVKLFDDFRTFVDRIQEREAEHGLSRMIAGYSWEWKSKNNPDAYDIEIQGLELKWNRTNADWINSEGSVNDVGCIHTTQGYDLNYAGIIFGHEIGFDKKENKLIIRQEHYHDRNGRVGIEDPGMLRDYILNIYKTILLRGIKGTYVYVCDQDLRDYLSQYLPVDGQTESNVTPDEREIIPFENSVPFYDLQVAAGDFSELQQVGNKDFMLVPDNTRVTKNHFAVRLSANP